MEVAFHFQLEQELGLSLLIIPLHGPSCKLRLARLSAKLKFQARPKYGNIEMIHPNIVELRTVLTC